MPSSVICCTCRHLFRSHARRLVYPAARRCVAATSTPYRLPNILDETPSQDATIPPQGAASPFPFDTPMVKEIPTSPLSLEEEDIAKEMAEKEDATRQTVNFLRKLLDEEASESKAEGPAAPLERFEEGANSPAKTTQQFMDFISSAVHREADPMEILPVFRRAVYRYLKGVGGVESHFGIRHLFITHEELFLGFLYLKNADKQKTGPASGTMRMIKENFGLCVVPRRERWSEILGRLPIDLMNVLYIRAEEALELASRMAERAPFRGSTFRASLKEMIRNNNLRGLEEFYKTARRKRALTELVYCQFIGAFLEFKSAKNKALDVWDAMTQDGIVPGRKTWGVLLRYGRNEPVETVLEIWDRMIKAGVRPDSYCWNIRIHTQIVNNHCAEGMESLQLMIKSAIMPDSAVINAALVGLLGHDRMDLVQEVLELGEAWNVKPDTMTYNIILGKIMQNNGTLSRALSYLADMEKRSIRFDVYTFTIIINGLVRSESISGETFMSDTLKILKFMEMHAIPASIATYTTILSGLLNFENYEAVRVIRKIMAQHHIAPTSETYTVLVKDAFKQRNLPLATKLYRQITSSKTLRMDHILWSELAFGFASIGSMDNFRDVLQLLVAREGRFKIVLTWRTCATIVMMLKNRNEVLALKEFVEYVAASEPSKGDYVGVTNHQEEKFWGIAAQVGGRSWAEGLHASA